MRVKKGNEEAILQTEPDWEGKGDQGNRLSWGRKLRLQVEGGGGSRGRATSWL